MSSARLDYTRPENYPPEVTMWRGLETPTRASSVLVTVDPRWVPHTSTSISLGPNSLPLLKLRNSMKQYEKAKRYDTGR